MPDLSDTVAKCRMGTAKKFYTSITSLSHTSKKPGHQAVHGYKGLADLKDKVVGVSSGSTSARALVKAMIDEGVLDGANFDADTFNADTWKDGISFRQYDDYPAISTALSAGEVQGFCVDKSILAIYKTEGRSYIDAEFSPQEYGVATKKGSDFSTLCDDLVKGWLADGTIEQLIKDNGLD